MQGVAFVEYSYTTTTWKVHRLACLELKRIIEKIANIFTALESARPRCKKGLQALCSLHNCMEKCELLFRHCSESSKLYLAISGEKIILRCERICYSLELCLSQLQNMVEPTLAAKVSQILDYVRNVVFTLDSSDDEAGRVLLDLLHQDIKTSKFAKVEELKAFNFAASRLHITSPLAIMIEKRSIRKLLSKILNTDPAKKKILNYLLYLVTKYGKSTKQQDTETIEDAGTEYGIDEIQEKSKGFDCNPIGPNLFILGNLSVLPWASRRKAVEDVKNQLKDVQQPHLFKSTCYICPVFKFLKDAHKLGDSAAKRHGVELILMFLKECRTDTPPLPKGVISDLSLFLDSDITEEALLVLQLLSCQQHYTRDMVTSGILLFLQRAINDPKNKHHNVTLKVLCNLSAHEDLGHHMIYLGFIQDLVPFLDELLLSGYCVQIFKNLCNIEEAAAHFVENESCITSIGELLELGKVEEQENALEILTLLYYQREEAREILMQDDIISSLVHLSENGSCKGKLMSVELLRLLNNAPDDCSQVYSLSDASQSTNGDLRTRRKSSVGFFGGRKSVFGFSLC
ncbi:hypothetical protein E3N88_42771 [Mikania micrantha]|uniref:Uncharacterized protein n=1 Tax=Mikania micrantha TaxID=192012 RepID=A0A5N6LGU3_9ASTR|nr:hypothetical protein E3N88_42771 [Mikania micrantha]